MPQEHIVKSYEQELKRLRDGMPADALLVIDSAYAEFVDRPDYTAGEDLVDAQRGLRERRGRGLQVANLHRREAELLEVEHGVALALQVKRPEERGKRRRVAGSQRARSREFRGGIGTRPEEPTELRKGFGR